MLAPELPAYNLVRVADPEADHAHRFSTACRSVTGQERQKMKLRLAANKIINGKDEPSQTIHTPPSHFVGDSKSTNVAKCAVPAEMSLLDC
jgi:hypothetical protein